MKKEYEKLLKKADSKEEAIDRLVEIVKVLRVECPWDKAQNHNTLRSCMIEEAYELCEAIDNEDDENLREELGDVMLQVLFHSVLAEERKKFQLEDVINDECEKMIRRHPHVFSSDDTKSVDKVLEKWENIKCKEHSYESATDVLKNVPKNFPALIRAFKVQKKAADVGFDWDDIKYVYDKVEEGTNEIVYATKYESQEEVIDELGDLLFAVVNLGRFLKVNPEEALTRTTEKFINRFEFIETQAKKENREMKELTLEEMDAYWEKAKCE